MITLNIDVTKLDPAHFLKGQRSDFATLRAMRRDDQFGRQWMVVQGISLEAKRKGEKGAIVGHGKNIGADHKGPLVIVELELKAIDKKRLFKGEKGSYLNVTLTYPTKADGDLDCHYIVRQEVTREERAMAIKGQRVGIARKAEYKPTDPRDAQQGAPFPDDDHDARPTLPANPPTAQADGDGEYPF